MRPVRLSMQAFGPYATRETVDFREAITSGLFGIYGPTGSGKSSIFNAMMFALFGEATKEKFETTAFRSGHADPALPTEVEFIFEIGARTFLIRRRPEQLRPKQRGSGETRMAHEGWLFDVSDVPLDAISDTITGKMIAERKIGAVDAAVEQLLGYGAQQFRQIVLLPQGKFEAFLAANTKDRMRILGQLFDVSIYKRLAERLKDDAKSAADRVKTAGAVCEQRLRAEQFDSGDALVEGIAAAHARLADDTRREAEATETLAQAQDRLDAERLIDGLFETAAKAAADLTVVQRQTEAIQQLTDRVANARRAQALGDVERQWRAELAAVTDADRRQKDASRLLEAAEVSARTASESLAAAQSRTDEINALRMRGEALDRHAQTLASAAGLEARVREETHRLNDLARKHQAAVAHAQALLAQKRERETTLRATRDRQANRQFLTTRHLALTATSHAARTYEKAAQDHAAAQAHCVRHRAALADARAQTTRAAARLDAAEQDLARVQALHLASKLQPGEACPVCGALDHPAPADGHVQDLGLNDAFKAARAALDAARATEQMADRNLASADATCEERRAKLADLAAPETPSIELDRQLADLNAQIAVLGPEADISALEAGLATLDADHAAAEEKREMHRAHHNEAAQDHVRAISRWESALETVPEPLRNRDALTHATTETVSALKALQDALVRAEQRATATREALLAAAKDSEATAAAHDAAFARRDLAHATFADRLSASGMADADYHLFKSLIPQIESDQARIDDHSRALALAQHQDAAAQQAIAGRTRPDLAPALAELETAKSVLHLAATERTRADMRCQHLEMLRVSIAEELERIEQVKADVAPLLELADQFNGFNRDKLNLETFAIGEMFTEVLAAANLRYGPMSGERYTFERTHEEMGGSGLRGLGIAILDVFTGKRRSPSTLSGGETFIAALALALGLSDVVESLSGHVRLDTIFIDEGFGSLDTEAASGTLDGVLEALRTLVSQNRAVGIISHVPQVQEAIPNGFYIRKDARGSHVEVREAL